jgi:CRP-like cAMP-binding protein
MPLEEFLRDVYLFAILSDAEMSWIIAKSTRIVLNAGDTLFQEGCAADRLYVIESGTIVVSKRAVGGLQRLARLGPRAILGEIAYIEAAPRSASAEATERSVVIEIPFAAFDERLNGDPVFGFKLYRALAHELVKTVNRTTNDLTSLKDLAFTPV